MKNFEKIILPELLNIADSFSPITLGEMDEVQFMNRTDTKFVLSARQLPALLKDAAERYRMLEIEGERSLAYKTTYFDTEDYHFFREHLKGKLNRFKVRHRVYEVSGISFLEVKFKSNKKRTIKWRIKNKWTKEDENLNEEAVKFLSENITVDPEKLKPVLENNFKRFTLVNNKDKERVTIDFNLSFKDFNGKHEHLPYIAIVELKREGFTCQSPFISLLKKYELRESGFSKYCVGNAILYDHEYLNALKPKFLQLNKLKDDYDFFVVA
ncbi:MAG: polyphosphate polymerase domain-containing protein [Marinilabiliaceae bacterium]|nr:polyphosphate polymerase domain-containing protein [Marinilabiliaceae bacterium]